MSHFNCPTCGAKTDSIISNCEYCGVEFSKAQTLSPQEFVTAIGRSITVAREKVDKIYANDAEEAALKAVPIPSDIPTLTAFFMFCHSNVKGGIEGMSPHQLTWRSKAKGTYDMLRLASLNNAQLSTFLEEFKSMYSAEGMKAYGKTQAMVYGVIIAAFALILIIAGIIGR